MDFEFTLEERALAKTVKDFVDERVEPQMREIEEKNQIPEELLTRIYEGTSEIQRLIIGREILRR
jgi:alkylation response protein AidB-like acyl-CoA dehydrogenase